MRLVYFDQHPWQFNRLALSLPFGGGWVTTQGTIVANPQWADILSIAPTVVKADIVRLAWKLHKYIVVPPYVAYMWFPSVAFVISLVLLVVNLR